MNIQDIIKNIKFTDFPSVTATLPIIEAIYTIYSSNSGRDLLEKVTFSLDLDDNDPRRIHPMTAREAIERYWETHVTGLALIPGCICLFRGYGCGDRQRRKRGAAGARQRAMRISASCSMTDRFHPSDIWILRPP